MNKKIENMDLTDLIVNIGLAGMGSSVGLIILGSSVGSLGVELYKSALDSSYPYNKDIAFAIVALFVIGLGISIPLLISRSNLEEEYEKRLILGRWH